LTVTFVSGLAIETLGGRLLLTTSVTSAGWETGPLVPVILSG